jgi:uncharacterized protein YjiS (DUF1127 family)
MTMTIVETARNRAVVAHRDTGFGALMVDALHRIAARRAERRAMRQLSRYPDAMLKDMGITRAEIPDLVRHGRSEIVKLRRD